MDVTTAPTSRELIFVPERQNQRDYRNALGSFTTGVTVVTAMAEHGPIGMTVNSFASVSLEPPLVLWSPSKTSSKHGLFTQAEHFAIHVLGAEQDHLCRAFSKGGSAFAGLPWSLNEEGVPTLPDTLTRFECQRASAHDAGDHTILLGRVLRVALRDGDPLCFSRGALGRFAGNN
ncbi:flavin reductase (DIM6/NTAB) family NADH-FMN oxidoreductase RutF [Pseudorhizobium tarimense]|uniref:Flavin reductase (DIM6/NTAB) family NADH-FMN oxidoreductase RutF n=1 Tax=Pseudorhizobium tarimense TaxID=1079109 RepID=A0ABV2H4P4_9HYPH|nr:flavin reductase family protein [Pseudorhizobium tarimense]MCJ8518743.1 flavin reductase family protein [Pseudorhizobium tarimense]